MTDYDNWKLHGSEPSATEEEEMEGYLEEHPEDPHGYGFDAWLHREKEADEGARGEYLADLAEDGW